MIAGQLAGGNLHRGAGIVGDIHIAAGEVAKDHRLSYIGIPHQCDRPFAGDNGGCARSMITVHLVRLP